MAFLVSAAAAHAQLVLASNLGNAGGAGGASDQTTWVGVKFTTTSSPFSVGSITMSVTSNSSAHTERVRIFTDNFGHPGSDTGLVFSTSTATGNVTYNLVSGGSLSANTIYWIVTQGTNGSVNFNATTTPTGTGPGFLSAVGKYTLNSGSSWSNLPNSSTPMFSISAIPEPSTWAAIAGACAGVVAVGLRRAKRRKGTNGEQEIG